jgi:fructose-1,6-bisphosphatase I
LSAPAIALGDHLANAGGPAGVVAAIAQAAIPLAGRLAAGLLSAETGTVAGINGSGDQQKSLDLAAHDMMLDALRGHGVRRVLSEEGEDVVELDAGGVWDVAIDPIDGSDSIGIGAPLGTLFGVWPSGREGFACDGRAIVAAGYVSFGHSTDFGWTLGDGVSMATLDRPAGCFRVVRRALRIPPDTSCVAYNASNLRHWPDGLRAYARDLVAGSDGPRGRDFNMRWLAAAVGELHRIMLRGGTFLYPGDHRPGYEHGRLRLAYEAMPIAFLMEQAGGLATDGATPILDRKLGSYHEHTPLVFGSSQEVETIGRYASLNNDRG